MCKIFLDLLVSSVSRYSCQIAVRSRHGMDTRGATDLLFFVEANRRQRMVTCGADYVEGCAPAVSGKGGSSCKMPSGIARMVISCSCRSRFLRAGTVVRGGRVLPCNSGATYRLPNGIAVCCDIQAVFMCQRRIRREF